MQSIMGALLTAGYASAATSEIADAPDSAKVTDSIQSQLTKSYSSAANAATQYPQNADQIIAGAREAFTQGQDWAYVVGIVFVLGGAALVYFLFPKPEEETELLASYHRQDAVGSPSIS